MGKKDSKHSNSSDRTLFRSAVANSKPLKTVERYRASSAAKSPIRSTAPDSSEANGSQPIEAAGEFGEVLSFERGYINRKTLRELKRGKMHVADEIDLHGLTSIRAKTVLNDFIDECLARNFRCVRVIHGKGLGSGPRGPVLKTLVSQDLQARREVIAFCSARPSDGGTGAVYVLLKTK